MPREDVEVIRCSISRERSTAGPRPTTESAAAVIARELHELLLAGGKRSGDIVVAVRESLRDDNRMLRVLVGCEIPGHTCLVRAVLRTLVQSLSQGLDG